MIEITSKINFFNKLLSYTKDKLGTPGVELVLFR